MKLKIDEHWQVEIPFELRQKYNLKKNSLVHVNFNLQEDNHSDNFECLLKTLAHDGVLIDIPLN